jgi:hypothetical protein
MADNLNLRGPRDRSRVNVHEDYELKYWSTKFGVTHEQLRAAVTAVGVMAHDVARYLGKPL